MKLIEPVFDRAGEFWRASSDAPQQDISALENRIARQSSELDLRLTEFLNYTRCKAGRRASCRPRRKK